MLVVIAGGQAWLADAGEPPTQTEVKVPESLAPGEPVSVKVVLRNDRGHPAAAPGSTTLQLKGARVREMAASPSKSKGQAYSSRVDPR